jgi:hypothetical protein
MMKILFAYLLSITYQKLELSVALSPKFDPSLSLMISRQQFSPQNIKIWRSQPQIKKTVRLLVRYPVLLSVYLSTASR